MQGKQGYYSIWTVSTFAFKYFTDNAKYSRIIETRSSASCRSRKLLYFGTIQQETKYCETTYKQLICSLPNLLFQAVNSQELFLTIEQNHHSGENKPQTFIVWAWYSYIIIQGHEVLRTNFQIYSINISQLSVWHFLLEILLCAAVPAFDSINAPKRQNGRSSALSVLF